MSQRPQRQNAKQQTPKSQRASARLESSAKRKQQYKELLDKGSEINDRLENVDGITTLKEVADLINRTDAISVETANTNQCQKNASEAVMDAQVIKMGHELVGSVAQRLGQNEFSEELFVTKIFDVVKENYDWELLLEDVLFIPKRCHFGQSMFGAFEHEPAVVEKPRKERVVRQKAETIAMKRPDQVDKLQKEEKGADLLFLLNQQISEEFNRRQEPIPYFEAILDPDDFMATIDNAFQISFLIRDGKISVIIEDNEPYIVVKEDETQSNNKKANLQTVQSVLGINVAKWNYMRETYGRKDPILKVNRSDFLTQQKSPS